MNGIARNEVIAVSKSAAYSLLLPPLLDADKKSAVIRQIGNLDFGIYFLHNFRDS